MLTVATDTPAYSPWFSGNNPSNGKGYESAVAYAVAKQLGFTNSQVHWTREPFNDSYAPGPKKFDFDINEISYSPQRATAVTFSNSYYDVDQALVALKNTPIVTRHAPADLKGYVFGDQVGTTSLAFINSQHPADEPPEDLPDPERRQAGAADPPDRRAGRRHPDRPVHLRRTRSRDRCSSGSSPAPASTTAWSSARATRWSPASTRHSRRCKANGTLAKLQQKYLKIYTSVPALKP